MKGLSILSPLVLLAAISCPLDATAAEPTAPTLDAAVAAVEHLSVDPAAAAPVRDLAFEREGIAYRFEQGWFYRLTDGAGREVGMVFLGDGAFTFAPASAVQRQGLYGWTYFKDNTRLGFSRAVIAYTGDSPLPVTWGGAGPDPEKAQRVVDKRWAAMSQWSRDVDAVDYDLQMRPPSVRMDLIADALAPASGPGMTFIEADAQPMRGRLYRRTTPQRWWYSLYESPSGVRPLARTTRTGALFIHAHTRAGWRVQLFDLYDGPAPLHGTADVLETHQEITLKWDGQFERLHVMQDATAAVAAATPVLRLSLVPEDELSLEQLFRADSAGHTVRAVTDVDGQALPFVYENGELLIASPAPVSKVSLDLRSEMPGNGGTDISTGIHALPTPSGGAWDPATHRITVSAPADLDTVIAGSQGADHGADLGRSEIAAGTFLTHTGRSRAGTPITGHVQAFGWGPLDASEALALQVAGTELSLGFLEWVHGPLPLPGLEILQGAELHTTLGAVALPRATFQSTYHARAVDLTGLTATLARQWWHALAPQADPVRDGWFADSLCVALGVWGFDAMVRASDVKDKALDQYGKDAVRAQGAANRALLVAGLTANQVYDNAQDNAYTGRAVRAFTNARLAVGDDVFANGLRVTFDRLRGTPWTPEELVSTLSAAVGVDLAPLLLEGIPTGEIEGAVEIAWSAVPQGKGERLTAQATARDAGVTLGAPILVTLRDGREQVAFVKLDGGLDLVLDAPVRSVRPITRGAGLARTVKVQLSDSAVATRP